MKTMVSTLFLLWPTLALAVPPPMPECLSKEEAQLVTLHREIAAAKLDKVLNLSRDQAKALVPVIQDAVAFMEQVKAEHEKRAPALAKALTQVRDDVRRDGVASAASSKALKDARGEANMESVRLKLKSLRDKAREILTPEQRERLAQFDPRPLGGMEGPGEGEPPPAGEPDEAAGPGAPGHHRMGHEGKGPRHDHRGIGHELVRVVSSQEFLSLLQARAK
jgi:hypothetical protein